MKKSEYKDKDIDRLIRKQLRKETPAPPRDEWFVKKVLNRLPPRRQSIFGVPEIIACFLVGLGGLILAIQQTRLFIVTADPLEFDFTKLICSLGVCILTSLYLLIPSLRKC